MSDTEEQEPMETGILLALVQIVETSGFFCHLDFYVKSNQSFKIVKFDFT